MRKNISDVYPGMQWKVRVSEMKPEQVYAVYYKFLETGKFNKKKKRKNKKEKDYRQMTIFDFLTTEKGDV